MRICCRFSPSIIAWLLLGGVSCQDDGTTATDSGVIADSNSTSDATNNSDSDAVILTDAAAGDTTVGDASTSDGRPACPTGRPLSGKPKLGLARIADGLGQLVDIGFAPGDREHLFAIDQRGLVRVVRHGSALPLRLLDIQSQVSDGNEQGLLSLVFHPNFAANRLFYVYYTDRNNQSHVTEYQVASDKLQADPQSRRTILSIPQAASNHNGGALRFGPKDGYLYLGLGDGGGSNDDTGANPIGNGQDTRVLLGKIVRIDVDRKDAAKEYAVPTDNPFVGNSAYLPEIFHLGLRNPWRMSFDRQTGDLWIGDVGQNRWEEINVARHGQRGLNFGWRCREGAHDFRAGTVTSELLSRCNAVAGELVDPVVERSQSVDGFYSIIAGYRYRGCLMPGFHNTYFYTDHGAQRVWAFDYDGNKAIGDGPVGFGTRQITTFGEDNDGELYVGTRAGSLYKIAAETP